MLACTGFTGRISPGKPAVRRFLSVKAPTVRGLSEAPINATVSGAKNARKGFISGMMARGCAPVGKKPGRDREAAGLT